MCAQQPGLRLLYPSTSKYARRAPVADFMGRAPLPDPTTAAPGSPEKIAILQERARSRVALHHPRDVMLEPYPVPWVAPMVKFPEMLT